jgi:hypothetical protein
MIKHGCYVEDDTLEKSQRDTRASDVVKEVKLKMQRDANRELCCLVNED